MYHDLHPDVLPENGYVTRGGCWWVFMRSPLRVFSKHSATRANLDKVLLAPPQAMCGSMQVAMG